MIRGYSETALALAMDRRAFLGALGLLAVPLAAGAQPAGGAASAQSSLPLIAVLHYGKEGVLRPRHDAFLEGLRALGYQEGRNYRMEVRWSDNQMQRLPRLARELLALGPAVVVAEPVIAARAVFLESKTVPIVMAGGSGAHRYGMIASLARPGGNVTGVDNQLNEVSAKQLQLLKDFAPRVKRVMALSSGLGAAEDAVRDGSRAAAKANGITLIEALADTPEKLGQLSALCIRERCEGLLVLLDPNLSNFRTEVIAMAVRLHIPAAYPLREFANEGGLFAYSTDILLLARRAASYVDKILKGVHPGELPVERPTKFELVINLKTAKALGLTIPPSLLQRADQVIE